MFAIDAPLFPFIFERPGLRAALLKIVIEPQPGFGMDHIEHHMYMLVGLILMSDEQRLVLLPLHMAQKFLRGLNHMLARRIVFGRPVEAQMLDGIFGRAAAGANAGFLLEQLGVTRGPEHFVDGRWHMIVGKIVRVGPRYPLVRLRPGVVGEIGG